MEDKLRATFSSNPNLDLLDINDMPNMRASTEELSKEQRKPRLTRQFLDNGESSSNNETIIKRKHTLGKTIENEDDKETTPGERIITPLKDHSDSERKGPIILSGSEKKSYKELASNFFHLPFKPKKHSNLNSDDSPSASAAELRRGSMDSLNSSTVLYSTTSNAAISPPSVTDSESEDIPSKGKDIARSPTGHTVKDLTGYRSSKMALNNNEGSVNYTGYRSSRMTISMSPSEGYTSNTLASHTTYNAMSNLRQSRMSGMFGSNTDNKASPAQNSKTFRQYFRTLLEEHDNGQRDNMSINRRPKILKLSAIFGIRGERTDPMIRLMWMSAYHESVKNDPVFMTRPKDGIASIATISKKANSSRILDLDLEANPPGIEFDSSQALDFEMIMAGTEKGLLDRLIIPLYEDLSYPEVFLASYRFFISPMQVFQALTEWYNVSSEGSVFPGATDILHEHQKAIQVRSLRIILLWIRNHWQDFLDNHGLWSQLRNFSKFLADESFSDFQKIMHAIREERLSWMTSQYIPMFPGIREFDSTSFWCPEVDTEKFAHDLTMLDHIFFRQIKPDLYLQILSKPGTILSGAYNIPLKGIFDYCNWFRMVASYPSSLLAIQENTKKRTMTIRLIIKIAKTCLDLGNLQGSFALIYGLKQPAALIWYSAWEALPSKSMDYFKAINTLMSNYDGYKNYWEYLQKLQPPAVPYLVPHLHDILFLFENTPHIKNGNIASKTDEGAPEEVEKCEAQSDTIQENARTSDGDKKESTTKRELANSTGDESSKLKVRAGENKTEETEKNEDDKRNSKVPSKRNSNLPDSTIHAKLLQRMQASNKEAQLEENDDGIMINFQKFYDIFSVAAELERFRMSSYHHVLRSEKTSACVLLQHIRFVSKRDEASIGSSVTFNSGILPDDNEVLNSDAAIKNIKKIVNLLAGKEES